MTRVNLNTLVGEAVIAALEEKEVVVDLIEVFARDGLMPLNGSEYLAMTPAAQWPYVALADTGSEEAVALLRVPSHWATMNVRVLGVNPGTNSGNVQLRTRLSQVEPGDLLDGATNGSYVTFAAGSRYQVQEITDAAFNGLSVDPSKYIRIGVQRSSSVGLTGDYGIFGIILERAS